MLYINDRWYNNICQRVKEQNWEEFINKTNGELDNLSSWLRVYKLKLNADKNKVMVLGSKSQWGNYKNSNFKIKMEKKLLKQCKLSNTLE